MINNALKMLLIIILNSERSDDCICFEVILIFIYMVNSLDQFSGNQNVYVIKVKHWTLKILVMSIA